ncbi:hypothetical protein AUK11_02730 [bacterium CG2_30_37_16]|nr:MAG: hypothetical protein AUK11_02730 [bacterium CG2_30_37_16]
MVNKLNHGRLYSSTTLKNYTYFFLFLQDFCCKITKEANYGSLCVASFAPLFYEPVQNLTASIRKNGLIG